MREVYTIIIAETGVLRQCVPRPEPGPTMGHPFKTGGHPCAAGVQRSTNKLFDRKFQLTTTCIVNLEPVPTTITENILQTDPNIFSNPEFPLQ